MNVQLFESHFLILVNLAEVHHTLVVQLGMRKVQDLNAWKNRRQNSDTVWTKIVVAQVQVLKLDPIRIIELSEKRKALHGQIIIAEIDLTN